LSFKNVVEAPMFDLEKPITVKEWPGVRHKAPGLWSDIAGKHIVITCPSESVRALKDPTLILEYWDNSIRILQ
jgi:hypothetical protein